MDTPTRIYGEDLPDFVDDTIGDAHITRIEGGPSLKVAYRADDYRSLAMLNLSRIRSDPGCWQGTLHWGNRGDRQHLRFLIVGPIRWVIDPRYMQGRIKQK